MKAVIVVSIISMMLAVVIAGCLVEEDPSRDKYPDLNPGDWAGTLLDERNATDEGVEEMALAINQFGIDVLQQLLENDEGNLFISPYSIFTALSMTYEGARNNTAAEMADVLHLPDDHPVRLASFARMQNDINKGSTEYDLSTANAIWPKVQYEWKDQFINTIKHYYDGKVQELDYFADPEACRETINTWVENRTNDRIQDLIPQDMITSLTYMVLTNAIYFKGEWVYEFNEDETEERTFHSPGGDVHTDIMSMLIEDGDTIPYYEDEDVQAIELPYRGDNLSMMVILPEDGDVDSFLSNMDASTLDDISNGMSESEVLVDLPKFKQETKYELVPAMQALGVHDAFIGGTADFSGMSDQGIVPSISNIVHQTFIEVDEKGTEAAAATAVVIRENSMPSYHTFNADSPFLYLIKQNDTGNILFIGTMKDPTI